MQLENGNPSPTRTSQTPLAVTASLPNNVVAASDKYRSVNDPTRGKARKISIIDTPGHGKLRHFALSNFTNAQALKGVIFVVDAASISASLDDDTVGGSASLTETAEYLHDVLLTLQKRQTSKKSAKRDAELPILVAANKLDLFTALPAKMVKRELEKEITKLRETRSKGLLDSGVGMDDVVEDDEREVLGGAGEGSFSFGLMEEYGISIDVRGGSVSAPDGADVGAFWEWIAEIL